MGEIQVSADHLEILLKNSVSHEAAIALAIEWAHKASDYVEKVAHPRIEELEAENKRLQNRIDIAEDCFEAYEALLKELDLTHFFKFFLQKEKVEK